MTTGGMTTGGMTTGDMTTGGTMTAMLPTSEHAERQTKGLSLEIVDASRSFNKVRALGGLSISVAPGELVALLGPSGCGKTTALRAVAGLEQLDFGSVRVGGSDVTNLPPHRRHLGMVFQAYSLFPNMNALDNVAFGLEVRKVPAAKRRARAGELLDLVGLTGMAPRFAHELSGGQQQRVALARALCAEPDLLLLDEPLSALDAKVRLQLRDEIRRIQLELGITTLFVTHDQEEALSMSDRVGVMRNGKLEQLAPPPEVYSRPATDFVAEFVGSVSRLPGRVAEPAARPWRWARLSTPSSAQKAFASGPRPRGRRWWPGRPSWGRRSGWSPPCPTAWRSARPCPPQTGHRCSPGPGRTLTCSTTSCSLCPGPCDFEVGYLRNGRFRRVWRRLGMVGARRG
jgi:putative spermidine/putrescine transport system ATP-binding protein